MPEQPPQSIRTVPIEEEMKDSYLNYAMSVIVSRALPDVRDGLKPSQRRILVAMNDLGLTPRSKFRKCAKIAGDTSGNYHPHGEQVVYPTLVRMAQEFSMRYPLIEGQGNFGSVDGDPPAAMRYTEARLTEFAMQMLEDLDKDTVNFVPNYDETREEPTVLPSKFPNLICNGSSGIAVGMATSVPPHNLGEVCDALILLIDKPESTVADLMAHVKGPDFPTGGIICGTRGLRAAYETGRGLIAVRGRIRTEETKGGKKQLIITEIPYNQSKAKLIERIAELVKEDQIQGISDIRDESDREGMRIVIDLRKDGDENVITNQLYAATPLQDTFSIINIALVHNRPRMLDLQELLQEYLNHRKEVIQRRTRFLLEKAEQEAHILEGLAKALQFIDEVIAIIKKSRDPATAKAALIERFEFTPIQADAILRMTLQRLTGLEQEQIRKDLEELHRLIAEYKAILADEVRVMQIIRKDLEELKKSGADERRTEISADEVQTFDVEELIPEEEMVVVLSHQGYIKRVPLTSYRKQKRGGKGVIGAETKETDFIEHLFVASTHAYLLFFTDRGRVHWLKVYDLPELARTAKGKSLVSLILLKEGEQITTLFPVQDFAQGYLVMATQNGLIKKTELQAYGNPQRGGIIALKLEEKDRLIQVRVTTGEADIVLGTAKGLSIRFSEHKLRSMGRATYGVVGVRLTEGDRVVDMVTVDPESGLLTVCENGFGKRSAFDLYRRQSRGGKGIRNIKATDRNGLVVGMKAVKETDDLMMISQGGMVVRISVKDIRLMGRSTQGVRLIKLDVGDKLVSIADIVRDEDEEEAKPAAQVPPKPLPTEKDEPPSGEEE